MITLDPKMAAMIGDLADDEHIVGSRHASWIGLGPFLEEDLAFCSIAQDELGHALALYELFVPAEQIDRHALLRPVDDYRSCQLAELECASWDMALVRHWLYDLAESLKWDQLANSEVIEISQLAVHAQRHERFHLEHASMFMKRMSHGGDSRDLITRGLTAILPVSSSVWNSWPDGFDRWRSLVAEGIESFGLDPALTDLIDDPSAHPRTVRSDGFYTFYTSLGEVISLDPTATW